MQLSPPISFKFLRPIGQLFKQSRHLLQLSSTSILSAEILLKIPAKAPKGHMYLQKALLSKYNAKSNSASVAKWTYVKTLKLTFDMR